MERTESTIKRHFTLVRAPKIMCVHLNRLSDFDQWGNVVKNNNFVHFEKSLKLSNIAGLSFDSEYELKSMIVHYGNAHGGHYLTMRQVNFGKIQLIFNLIFLILRIEMIP